MVDKTPFETLLCISMDFVLRVDQHGRSTVMDSYSRLKHGTLNAGFIEALLCLNGHVDK